MKMITSSNNGDNDMTKAPDTAEQTEPTEQFMATDIIMQPTASLIPYANNARTHSDAQIKQIAASIQSFGFTNPVLVDGQNGIIAGHGRILAAELLGLSEVPTICLPHLTNTAKRAYVLADNRIAINSGWDMETLAVEVQRIIDDGRYDVGDLGFDSAEVDEMLKSIINNAGNFGEVDLGEGKDTEIDPNALMEGTVRCPRCNFEFEAKSHE